MKIQIKIGSLISCLLCADTTVTVLCCYNMPSDVRRHLLSVLPGVQDRQVKKKMKLSLNKGAGLTIWDEQLIHKANAEPWVPSVPSQ